LGEVDLLGSDERVRLLDDWGRREATDASAEAVTLGRLWERQAAARPDAVAVVDGARSWSYAQLDSASDRIARRLREQGVGPEDVVAVLLPRGAVQIAAVLGVTKTGAAFLPVDPSYPRRR
ncbi:AMP-binding protein, partial [Streptomyces sp. AA8]|uniref:AMP-binding protein n=1 Tax=Streptomyces telluris TaxID=2720021 RepID=UPI00143BD276